MILQFWDRYFPLFELPIHVENTLKSINGATFFLPFVVIFTVSSEKSAKNTFAQKPRFYKTDNFMLGHMQ